MKVASIRPVLNRAERQIIGYMMFRNRQGCLLASRYHHSAPSHQNHERSWITRLPLIFRLDVIVFKDCQCHAYWLSLLGKIDLDSVEIYERIFTDAS